MNAREVRQAKRRLEQLENENRQLEAKHRELDARLEELRAQKRGPKGIRPTGAPTASTDGDGDRADRITPAAAEARAFTRPSRSSETEIVPLPGDCGGR